MSVEKDVEEALEHTKENRGEVLASEVCGCISCCATFSPHEVKDWTGEDRHHHHDKRAEVTAVCPHCGEAMVIGDRSGLKVSPATLDALRSRMRLG